MIYYHSSLSIAIRPEQAIPFAVIAFFFLLTILTIIDQVGHSIHSTAYKVSRFQIVRLDTFVDNNKTILFSII